jgi:hypothetical protein
LLGCFHTVLTHKHASNSCKYIGNDDNHACTLSPFPKTTIICGVFAPMRLLLIIQTKKKLAVFLAYIIYIYMHHVKCSWQNGWIHILHKCSFHFRLYCKL